MQVRHILVEHKYEAEDILRKLAQGEDFAALARKYSKCSSAANGGDLGKFNPDRLDDDFALALKNLKTNEISQPVRTKFGFHLIQKL